MLDAVASAAGKRAGQQLSIMFDGEWAVAVLEELRAWLAVRAAAGQRTIAFEQFRHDAIAQPRSHKSWGSLPAIACRAGLIAPMTHPDGSPVMRRAESVKTHSHPVRCWAIVSASSSMEGDNSPTLTVADGPQAQRHPNGIEAGGAVLHGGGGAELLRATAEYHRARGLGEGA